MNKAILIGNLTRDPEVRTTPNGNMCAMFTLAINRRFKDSNGNKQADFISIVAWRQLAELCQKYLKKGRKVSVVGQIQTRSYDAQDGTKRYVTEIVADEIEFLSSANAGNGAPMPPEPEYGQGGFTEVDDEEMPF